MASPRIALVTARAARGSDGDMPPLLSALHDAGTDAQELDWDDDAIDWSRFDLALLRSTWDYCERLPAFLAWAERVAAQTRLLNPLPVIRWNTDKHYLADLARAAPAPRQPQCVVAAVSRPRGRTRRDRAAVLRRRVLARDPQGPAAQARRRPDPGIVRERRGRPAHAFGR